MNALRIKRRIDEEALVEDQMQGLRGVATTPELSVEDTARIELSQAEASFVSHKAELDKFVEANSEVVQRLIDLAVKYNGSIGEVKDVLKAMPAGMELPASIKKLGFRKNKDSLVVSYDAAKLPAEVAAMQGVVTRVVNTKILDALLLAGVVSAEAVAPARSESYKPGALSGPAEISIKVGG